MSGILYFPLSDYPMGFHHFAAAEWFVRRNPSWDDGVVFLVAQGAPHLPMCEAAIAAFNDPAQSYLARRAVSAGDTLRLRPSVVVGSLPPGAIQWESEAEAVVGEVPPAWLAPFLTLTSPMIRRAAEAGDALAGMMPGIAVREGIGSGGLSEALASAQSALDAEAAAVSALLRRRKSTLAVVEGCVGGVLTAALAGRAGGLGVLSPVAFCV